MPLIRKIEVSKDATIGIWQVTEDAETLKWSLQWGQEDIKCFQALKSPQRCLHWLAGRVLLRKLMGTDKYIDLHIDDYGKPFLVNSDYKISISHSGNMVAVMLSKYECGLDIEELRENRIAELSHKFMSDQELAQLGTKHTEEKMYLHWCVKEALYKLYGKKKLDFKRNLFIYPFEYKPGGMLRARIEKSHYLNELVAHYMLIEDRYLLAYASEVAEPVVV